MNRRQEDRRAAREARRKCLTVSDAWRINEHRRNPLDHPSLGLRKRAGRPKRPRLVFPMVTQAEEAWRYLRLIYRCPEIRGVCRWMRSHPGPQCRLSPEALLVGIFLAADKTSTYHRTDVCSVINGLDATILYHLGLCDNKTFEPVSYSTVQKQLLRFERAPFTQLMREATPDVDLDGVASWTGGADGADPGLL